MSQFTSDSPTTHTSVPPASIDDMLSSFEPESQEQEGIESASSSPSPSTVEPFLGDTVSRFSETKLLLPALILEDSSVLEKDKSTISIMAGILAPRIVTPGVTMLNVYVEDKQGTFKIGVCSGAQLKSLLTLWGYRDNLTPETPLRALDAPGVEPLRGTLILALVPVK